MFLSKVLAFVVSTFVVAAGLMVLRPSTSAEAVPVTIPLTIKNSSEQQAGLRLQTWGHRTGHRLGQRHIPPLARRGRSRARRLPIAGPANGSQETIRMPRILRSASTFPSARSSSSSAPSSPASVRAEAPPTPTATADWSEYTLQRCRPVDQQHPGRRVRGGREGSQRHGQNAGRLESGGYNAVFSQLRSAAGRVTRTAPRSARRCEFCGPVAASRRAGVLTAS